MFGGSFRVARIAGISIEIHPSWLIILGFLSWSLADSVFPSLYDDWSSPAYWAVGVTAAVLLFVTVLVHELAHALVAKRRGLPVPKITLFIFGGVSHLSRQPASPGEEFQIAAAGPATSLVIALLTAGVALAAHSFNEKAEAIFSYLAVVNLLLAIFNLLPGFPLDGGRVLRSILWKRMHSFRRATRVAGSVGQVFGYILIAGGVFYVIGGSLAGLWYMLIGWFLLSAAQGESGRIQLDQILASLRARHVMDTNFHNVPPNYSVQAVVDEYMLGYGERAVMVADERGVLGIVTVNDVRKHPREEWSNIPAQRIMTPREKVVTVTADTPALEVLEKLAGGRLNQVPVLEAGRMVGIVTRRELLDRVQLAEVLAPDVPLAAPGKEDLPPSGRA